VLPHRFATASPGADDICVFSSTATKFHLARRVDRADISAQRFGTEIAVTPAKRNVHRVPPRPTAGAPADPITNGELVAKFHVVCRRSAVTNLPTARTATADRAPTCWHSIAYDDIGRPSCRTYSHAGSPARLALTKELHKTYPHPPGNAFTDLLAKRELFVAPGRLRWNIRAFSPGARVTSPRTSQRSAESPPSGFAIAPTSSDVTH